MSGGASLGEQLYGIHFIAMMECLRHNLSVTLFIGRVLCIDFAEGTSFGLRFKHLPFVVPVQYRTPVRVGRVSLFVDDIPLAQPVLWLVFQARHVRHQLAWSVVGIVRVRQHGFIVRDDRPYLIVQKLGKVSGKVVNDGHSPVVVDALNGLFCLFGDVPPCFNKPRPKCGGVDEGAELRVNCKVGFCMCVGVIDRLGCVGRVNVRVLVGVQISLNLCFTRYRWHRLNQYASMTTIQYTPMAQLTRTASGDSGWKVM